MRGANADRSELSGWIPATGRRIGISQDSRQRQLLTAQYEYNRYVKPTAGPQLFRACTVSSFPRAGPAPQILTCFALLITGSSLFQIPWPAGICIAILKLAKLLLELLEHPSNAPFKLARVLLQPAPPLLLGLILSLRRSGLRAGAVNLLMDRVVLAQLPHWSVLLAIGIVGETFWRLQRPAGIRRGGCWL